MGTIEIALLGPVQVRLDGTAVPLPSARQRVVLACLALDAGRPVSVPRLIDALWPAEVPDNASGNLQSHVSRLRRKIGGDRLVHDPGGYRLAVETTDVDVGVARALVAEARALAPADPAAAAGQLDRALRLWRGEPLADLPDRLAFAPEVAQLDEWRRQLSEERAELWITAGDAPTAIPGLEAAVATDDLRERTVTLLMRALHAAGRTADALAVAAAYRRRLAEQTGLDPGPALRTIEQQVLTDDPALRPAVPPQPTTTQRRPPAALQPPADRFVGRDEDLRRLADALGTHRLVTIVGPGGVGKTRLVLEALAVPLRGDGADRPSADFVALAGVADEQEVAPTTAAAVGLTAAPTGAVDALVDRLSAAPQLLVLDNCEHVRGAVARLVSDLLAACPQLRVVATSRRRLGVAGERVLRLGPLSDAAQVELFCDRVQLLRADFVASDHARGLVAQICAHLDGVPLAVELAAQREAVFGLGQLRDRLAGGLDILDARTADGAGGDGLMRTAEWSYRLLDDAARVLFDRLSVCVDGFGLDAAAHLAPEGTPGETLLAELVDASMVLVDHDRDPPRYRILEPIRQLGDHHLDGADRRSAEVAHLAWMIGHVATARRAQDRRSPDASRLLRRERANLRQALRRAEAHGAWDRAAALGLDAALLTVDDPLLDVLDRVSQLDRVADCDGVAGADRGRLLAAAGTGRWLRGDAAGAIGHCDTAVTLLPDVWTAPFLRSMARVFLGDALGVVADARAVLGDADAPGWVRASVVCLAALVHEFNGAHATATRWMDDHAELLTAVATIDGFVDYTRGELLAADDLPAALRAFERAEARCREAGLVYNRRVAQVARAGALVRLGRPDAAPACADALAGLREAGMWAQVWMLLRLAAELLVRRGDPATALALLDAADDDPLAPPVLAVDRERIARLRAAAAGEARPAPRIGGRAEAAGVALEALTAHG